LFFTKVENRKAKQVLSGRLVPAGEGGCKGGAWEGGYGGNVYTCVQMENDTCETVPGMGDGEEEW
jgi:hypothetical protein